MFSAATKTASTGGYQISRSLRFNSPDNAYLSRAISASNQKTWTYSGWLKRSKLGSAYYCFFSDYSASTDAGYLGLSFDTVDCMHVEGWTVQWRVTSQVFRDPSAWYHIVVAVDTTQATAANRIKVYVNGQQVTSFSTSNDPTLNQNLGMNSGGNSYISTYNGSANLYDGYMTEINFIDGQQLTPSSFGEYNADTGVWQPKAYSGSYGTNGFYLNFSDNSNTTAATLGKDYSGNGNNWTPNNFSVAAGAGNDSLVDVPTPYGVDTGVGGTVRGNYCTWNPLSTGGNVVLTNGNLSFSKNGLSGIGAGTLFVSSGKWYAEYTCTSSANMIGIVKDTDNPSSYNYVGYTANSYGYYYNGQKFNNNALALYGASYTTNDVIGVALDMDAGTVTFYKNGTSQGTAFTGLSGNFTIASGDNQAVSGELNAGQRPFAYTAPSGYKALCTQNLPTPTIGATTATQAGKYFNTVTYTGDGNSTKAVTGVGFQPDFLWIKERDATLSPVLYNVIVGAGAGKALQTDGTLSESGVNDNSTYGYVSSFDSDGFTGVVGTAGNPSYTNKSSGTYVAWNWKANGAGVTNTAGTITSTVSANTTSGFSIVTYTGTGSAATVGHGLGAVPKMIIAKRRDAAQDWVVYQSSAGAIGTLFLNDTSGFIGTSNVWDGSQNTSSVFKIFTAAEINASGGTYVAYCFADVPGYSKFGSYTGNGSNDGPFVYCGFRPRWILLKAAGSTTYGSWRIIDTARQTYNYGSPAATSVYLYPNLSDAESSGEGFDILSNGFKVRNTFSGGNDNGVQFIYAAFAENPFKYSLAR